MEHNGHTFDRRYEAQQFTQGQQYHCLCHTELQTPRPQPVVHESVIWDETKDFLAKLCRQVGLYFCPSCKEPDTDSRRHSLLHPECVLEARAHVSVASTGGTN